MASDLLLQLSGASVGNQVEAAAKTATGDGGGGGTGVYKYLGKYRSCQAQLRIGGAFDRSSGDEALVLEIWEATDAAGTGAVLIGSSAPQIASMAANLGSTGTVTLGSQPAVMSFNTGGGGYVKARYNFGTSTTPSAAGVSVILVPTSPGYLRFGT